MKVVIVGAGLAGKWHAHSARKSGASIIGVVDPDSTKARALSSSLGNIPIYSDLTEFLSKQKSDVIHICTPTESHFELASYGIDAGSAVLLEKPMAQSFDQVQRLYDLAREKNVSVCPVHQFLFQGGVTKILSQLSRVGELIHLEVVVQSAGGVGKNDAELDKIAGEILPHPLSLIQRFVPGGLSDTGWSLIRSRPGELSSFGLSQNIRISISISMNARPPLCYLVVGGTQGSFHADLFHGSSYFEPGSVSRQQKILQPFQSSFRSLGSSSANLFSRIIRWEPAYPGLTRLVADFYRSVQTRSDPPISAEDDLRVARVRAVLLDTR